MKKIILTLITLIITTSCASLSEPKLWHTFSENDKLISFAITDDNLKNIAFIGKKYTYVINDKEFNEKINSKKLNRLYSDKKEIVLKQDEADGQPFINSIHRKSNKNNVYQNVKSYKSNRYFIENLVLYNENGDKEVFDKLEVKMYHKVEDEISQQYILKEDIKIIILNIDQKVDMKQDLKNIGVTITAPIWIWGIFGLKI
ncbi:MAG: hypothetical protein IJ143_10450 [Neisseriaceae bacterium]|nr:hypothetical protein [Neisseriaceae bacterium]